MVNTIGKYTYCCGNFRCSAASRLRIFAFTIQELCCQVGNLLLFEKILDSAATADELKNENGAMNYNRFINGDKDGMTEVIREYKDGLSLYLNSLVRNICEAEELMEERFVELVVKKPKFTGKSSFRTWLFAIGRYIAYDYIKKNPMRKHLRAEIERKSQEIIHCLLTRCMIFPMSRILKKRIYSRNRRSPFIGHWAR